MGLAAISVALFALSLAPTTESERHSYKPLPPELAPLRDQAFAAARSMLASDVESVEVVATTQHPAQALLRNAQAGPDVPIWLVQARGNFAWTAPHPAGSPSIRARCIVFNVKRGAETPDDLFLGMRFNEQDLSRLGSVTQLHP